MKNKIMQNYLECNDLTLEASAKNVPKLYYLFKSSGAYKMLTILTNVSIEAKSVDTDQTAPIGAV